MSGPNRPSSLDKRQHMHEGARVPNMHDRVLRICRGLCIQAGVSALAWLLGGERLSLSCLCRGLCT